ncbi:hypothetical protein FM076_19805 [Streptomyces albus subsp. chlorinus]|uniref:hypothetical protein n=1 Tax=Streptomyces albus TaxID=1888 RepID=UPI00156D6B8B|nr:hypothetical protein [Streptomyces albus]NSC23272.1 hypothetical protein [Streptomyces albus subsp. chlorinus]
MHTSGEHQYEHENQHRSRHEHRSGQEQEHEDARQKVRPCDDDGGYQDLPEFPVLRPPSPVAGCGECERYARGHTAAERDGDASRAVDVRVLWRAHQARVHARAYAPGRPAGRR